jgi:hypothetical protein
MELGNRSGVSPLMTNATLVRAIGLGLMLTSSRCLAQADMNLQPPMSEAPSWVVQQVPNPDDPRVQDYARQQKTRVQLEKELDKIRFEFIHNMKNPELRSVGIHKIRGYTQPAIYESLLKIFGKEDADVRKAIVEHLADQKNDLADTTLAWAAVFGKFKDFRTDASAALARRIKESGKDGDVRTGIKSVVAHGLRSRDNEELAAAAGLAQQLKLIEAIPMLINAQIQGQVAGGGGGGDDHSLAWILVGTQQAYVSDLTPVVGDSAVAFDPQVSVVTSGTVLRIIDAVVITYQVDVHNALVGLSSNAWGKPTKRFGWDTGQWHKWYKEDFMPFLAQKQAAEKVAKQPT